MVRVCDSSGVADGLWAASSEVVHLGCEEFIHVRCWPDLRGVCSVADAGVALEGVACRCPSALGDSGESFGPAS